MEKCKMQNANIKLARGASPARFLTFCACLAAAVILVGAPVASELTKDQIEAEAKEIDRLIMAPCCWTQPVSDHYSGVSSDIRKNIRKMISEGKTRQEILDFYVAQYGERILSMPKASGFNLMAYVLPGLALLFGAFIVWVIIRAWQKPAAATASGPKAPAPTDDYARRLEEELKARQ